MDLTWPQVYLLLDGGGYNAAPDLEPEPGSKVESQGPPQSDEEAIRRDLQFAAMFDPSLSPQRIDCMIAEWREKQEALADGG